MAAEILTQPTAMIADGAVVATRFDLTDRGEERFQTTGFRLQAQGARFQPLHLLFLKPEA